MLFGLRYFALLSLLAAACGNLEPELNQSAKSGSVAESEFPRAYATAYCDALSSCCSAANLTFDHATCITNAMVDGQTLLNDRLTTSTDNAVLASSCISEVSISMMQCDLSVAANFCKTTFHVRTTPVGGVCHIDQDCARPDTGGEVRCYLTSAGTGICAASIPDGLWYLVQG